MKIIKDTDTSHYKYSGYGICFDAENDFSFGNIVNGKDVIVIGAEMSLSSHERNRQNQIYILGKDFIQGVTTIGPTALTGKTSKGTTIMQKIFINIILQNQIKILFLVCIIMVIILIHLLMGGQEF